jgi:hypothetical protein
MKGGSALGRPIMSRTERVLRSFRFCPSFSNQVQTGALSLWNLDLNFIALGWAGPKIRSKGLPKKPDALPRRTIVQMNDLCTEGDLSHHLREQFLYGYDAADTHVWAAVGVGQEPFPGEVLSLLDALDDALVETFMPSCLTLSQKGQDGHWQ